MENKFYNKQSLYGIPSKENITKSLIHMLTNETEKIVQSNGSARYNDYLIYDAPNLNRHLLSYANQYECVYFFNNDFGEIFINYLATCNNVHVTFRVNIDGVPDEINLSDNIESVTLIGIDHKMPILNGKKLKMLYLSGDETCVFEKFDMLSKNITELGLIDCCRILNINMLPENIKTITIMDIGLYVKNVPTTVEKIVYKPIMVCNGDDNPKNVHDIELESRVINKFSISNPENLKMTINVKKRMYLCRLDLGNNDSIVLRFPDKETADKYLFFGDDGYKLGNILLTIGVNTEILNYIELGNITESDTVLDWHHIRQDN